MYRITTVYICLVHKSIEQIEKYFSVMYKIFVYDFYNIDVYTTEINLA